MLCRFAGKSRRVAGAPLIFVNFRGLKPPHTMVNQGGSWVGFVEGNESFKMVVVALKKSTGVGRNRPWKMDGRACRVTVLGELSHFFFFSLFFSSFFLIGCCPPSSHSDWSLTPLPNWSFTNTNLIGPLSHKVGIQIIYN